MYSAAYSYFVRYFDIIEQEHPSRGFALGPSGASAITDAGVLCFLRELKKYEGQKIDFGELECLTKKNNLPYDEAVSFLLDKVGFIYPLDQDAHEINFSVSVVSDDALVSKGIADAIGGLANVTIDQTDDSSEQRESEVASRKKPVPVIVLYQTNYDPNFVRTAYKNGIDNAIFITAHLLKTYLFIDGLYSKTVGGPCHYCHQSGVLSSKKTGQDSSALIQYALNHKINLVPTINITNLERGLIVFSLVKRIKSLIAIDWPPNYSSNLLSFYKINLLSGEETRDLVAHAPSCGCLNDEW